MHVLGEAFPVLLGVGPPHWDATAVARMAEQFEPYFAQGQRYTFLYVQPHEAANPGAHERKLLIDWADSPRVREFSRKLSVGTALVLPNALLRGALTAMMWLWKPVSPIDPVDSVEAGLDQCLARLAAAGVPLPRSASALRLEALELLKPLQGPGPKLRSNV